MAAKDQSLIFGMHTVRHALEQKSDAVLEVGLQKGKKRSADLTRLLAKLEQSGVPVVEMSREELDQQSGNANHQGLVARVKSEALETKAELADILSSAAQPLLILVLDGVQDPHNFGACLRTANAAGVDAVIVARDNAAPLNATVSKVASGAAENTAIFRVVNIARTLRELGSAGVWIVGTDAQGEQEIYDVDLSVSTAIVVGAEGSGLRQNTRKHCDHLVSLPMQGIVESLNVSVASGICLYEALRQRRA